MDVSVDQPRYQHAIAALDNSVGTPVSLVA
jgi:hypothetical protein